MTEHTMTRECGCRLQWTDGAPEMTWFRYCPTHEAAPDLLEAVEETLTDLEAIYSGNGFDRHDADRAIERLRAALRKAKGEGDE